MPRAIIKKKPKNSRFLDKRYQESERIFKSLRRKNTIRIEIFLIKYLSFNYFQSVAELAEIKGSLINVTVWRTIRFVIDKMEREGEIVVIDNPIPFFIKIKLKNEGKKGE